MKSGLGTLRNAAAAQSPLKFPANFFFNRSSGKKETTESFYSSYARAVPLTVGCVTVPVTVPAPAALSS